MLESLWRVFAKGYNIKQSSMFCGVLFVFLFLFFSPLNVLASGHGGGESSGSSGGHGKKEEKKKKFNVIKLSPITVPVLQGGKVNSYYSFILDVGLKDESKYEYANHNAPRIMDSIVTELYIVFNLMWRKEMGDDLTLIKGHLISAVNRVLGEEIIKDIYLSSAKKAKDETINEIRKRG